MKGKHLPKEQKNALSIAMKNWIRINGHPRGMLGKHHSKETRQQYSLKRKGKRLKPWTFQQRLNLSKRNKLWCKEHPEEARKRADHMREFAVPSSKRISAQFRYYSEAMLSGWYPRSGGGFHFPPYTNYSELAMAKELCRVGVFSYTEECSLTPDELFNEELFVPQKGFVLGGNDHKVVIPDFVRKIQSGLEIVEHTNIKGRISGYLYGKILRYQKLAKKWRIWSITIVTKNGIPKDGRKRTQYLMSKSGLNIMVKSRNRFFLDLEQENKKYGQSS